MPLKTILRAAVLMIAATAAQSADNAGAPNLAAREAPGGAAVSAHWLLVDEAWNARDAAAFSTLFSEDTSFALNPQQVLEGRAAVRAHFEERFPQIPAGVRHQTYVDRVSPISPGTVAVDGSVRILEGTENGRAVAQVLRRFSIFAVMVQREDALLIRTLRIFREPDGADEGPGAERVLEIRSYNLKPGMVGTFERLFAEQAFPLLAEHGIDVVAYGRSLHDEDSWYLMRAFDDPAHRERAESAFYASDEWRDGPREAILDCIESYTTVVLPLDEPTVEQLRRLVK